MVRFTIFQIVSLERGKHQVSSKACKDLTDALEDAPYGTKELEGFPEVLVLTYRR